MVGNTPQKKVTRWRGDNHIFRVGEGRPHLSGQHIVSCLCIATTSSADNDDDDERPTHNMSRQLAQE